MNQVANYLLFLTRTRECADAVRLMLDARAAGLSVEELREHVAGARRDTGDSVTESIAMYAMVCLAVTIGVQPRPGSAHGFEVHDKKGRLVDVEAVPPAQLTRFRMITAIANADVGAARDTFNAFMSAHPDEVTAFIADVVDLVYTEAKNRQDPL